MTLIGNRPEWVLSMLACFRLGAVVLPCTEQLRAKDLRLRLAVARPRLVVADERNRAELEAALEGAPPEPTAPTTMPAPPQAALEHGGQQLERRGHRGGARARRLPVRRPTSTRRRAGARGPLPDHVHQRHRRRAQGGAARRSATCSASACRPPTGWARAPASWCGAPPPRGGRSRRATCSSPPGCRAPPRCCTTPASTPPSAWSCWRGSASTCCAWRPPSTA